MFLRVEPETTMNRSATARRNRRRPLTQPLVRTLFETCKDVFAIGGPGFVPRPNQVERLCSVMDSMKAADVGLSPEMAYFRATESGQAHIITFLQLYLCQNFSMVIFCLPASGVLPLHNHPEMTVFSKILFGSMHIKSYDWANDRPSSNPTYTTASQSGGLAKLKVNKEFVASSKTSVLYPAAGGNMHCFTALTACAVLDVLGPPYSDRHGRHCTYYLERPFNHFSENENERFAWLEEREKPSDLVFDPAPYQGPDFLDN